MNKELIKDLFNIRVRCGNLGYYNNNILKYLATKYGNVDSLESMLSGLCPEVDDKDNGTLVNIDVVTNLKNEGEPTYYYTKFNSPPASRHNKGNDPKLLPRWSGMNDRCLNPKAPNYSNYGGRGIKVCDAWHRANPNGRKNHSEWINASMPELFIGGYFEVDRIDNEDHYHPGNVRIASKQTNAQNKRWSVLKQDDVIMLRRTARSTSPTKYHEWSKKMREKFNINATMLNKAIRGDTYSNVDSIEPPVKIDRMINYKLAAIYQDMADRFMIDYRLTGIRLRPWCDENAHRWGLSGNSARKHIFDLLPDEYTKSFKKAERKEKNENYTPLTEDIVKRLRKESLNVKPIDYTEWIDSLIELYGLPRGTINAALCGATWTAVNDEVPPVDRNQVSKDIYLQMSVDYRKFNDKENTPLYTWCTTNSLTYGVRPDFASKEILKLLKEISYTPGSAKRKLECEGVVYNSIKEAAEEYGIKTPSMRKRVMSDSFPDFKFI